MMRAVGRARYWCAMPLALLLSAWPGGAPEARTNDRIDEVARWVVYYSDKLSPSAFEPYDLVVLDSRYHPPLRALRERGKILLGYISLGEVEKFRHHYAAVEDEGILFGTNPDWPDSRYVDVRDPRWMRRVLEDLVPAILAKGFDGVFLDTLDNPAHLERVDPERYEGMTRASAQLVQAMRRHYPHMLIMMNRAYEILPEVAGSIDIVLGESVFTDYDFKSKTYRRVPEALYRRQVELLEAARKANPRLKVYTLDYWYPSQPEKIREIYAEQKRNGFLPYVATVDLHQIVPAPE